MKKFYVTFGSNSAFPFPNSYIVIEAESEQQANEIFASRFPNRPGSDCLNYSFLYTEEEWNKSVSYYYSGGPKVVLRDEPIPIEELPFADVGGDLGDYDRYYGEEEDFTEGLFDELADIEEKEPF